jgi:hypothetical protein
MICNDNSPQSLTNWLLKAGVSKEEIKIAYNAWAALAMLQVDKQTIPQFVTAAQAISQARWKEFYATPKSSIMFLNEPLLRELSYQSEVHKEEDFDFDPAEVLPIVVTIAEAGPPTYLLNAQGAKLASDQNGDCDHFYAVIP